VILFWVKAKDPTLAQTKVDVIFFIFVLIPEIGWYIYGNTFIYSSQVIACKQTNPYDSLWICCLLVIIYGYFMMLLFFGVIVVGLGVFCLYRAWST